MKLSRSLLTLAFIISTTLEACDNSLPEVMLRPRGEFLEIFPKDEVLNIEDSVDQLIENIFCRSVLGDFSTSENRKNTLSLLFKNYLNNIGLEPHLIKSYFQDIEKVINPHINIIIQGSSYRDNEEILEILHCQIDDMIAIVFKGMLDDDTQLGIEKKHLIMTKSLIDIFKKQNSQYLKFFEVMKRDLKPVQIE